MPNLVLLQATKRKFEETKASKESVDKVVIAMFATI